MNLCIIRFLLGLSVIALCTEPAHADLQFQRPIVQLGKVRTGVPFTHQFQFVNTSAKSIEIVETRAGCGCVVPRINRKLIAPGAKGSIPVEVNTLGQSAGRQRWYVYVQYRIGEEVRSVALQMLVEVVTEVTVQPAKVAIHVSAGLHHEIRLTDLREKPLNIFSLRTTSKQLTVEKGRQYQDQLGNWIVKLRLAVTKGFPEGKSQEYLLIDTDDPIYQHFKIPVLIVKGVKNSIRAKPNRVDINVTEGIAASSRLLLLRHDGDEQVVLKNIHCNHPAIRCRWAAGPGKMSTVRVMIDPMKIKSNDFNSTIQIHVQSPVAEVLTIPVRYKLLK